MNWQHEENYKDTILSTTYECNETDEELSETEKEWVCLTKLYYFI